MTTIAIIRSAEVTSGPLPPAGQRPGADAGDPQLGLLRIAPNAGGNIGIWECQPGGWPINNRPDTEVAFILSGNPEHLRRLPARVADQDISSHAIAKVNR